MAFDDGARALGIQKPGRAVTGVLVTLFAVWLMFALAVNWGGAGASLFYLMCGDTLAILHGEVWRLFTAPLMHDTDSIWHVFFALLGLFFLVPSLEAKWGPGRTLRFLALSALLAYGFQMVAELVLPERISARLIGQYWFGAYPALDAAAIAWALSFKGRQIRLMFVVPVSSKGLLIFTIVMCLLRVVAPQPTAEGLISPFGGMLAGWLLGGGTPSPLRKAYLKLRLAQLDRESMRGGAAANRPKGASPLRVIEGGRKGSTPDRDGGGGGRMLH